MYDEDRIRNRELNEYLDSKYGDPRPSRWELEAERAEYLYDQRKDEELLDELERNEELQRIIAGQKEMVALAMQARDGTLSDEEHAPSMAEAHS